MGMGSTMWVFMGIPCVGGCGAGVWCGVLPCVGAVQVAVRAGHTDVVQFLLLNQATIDHATGTTQRTPLHDAAAHGHVAICYILLQHGASLTATVR